MRRVEKLGIDMAYALRELRSRRELYELASAEVKRIEQAILAADASEETGTQPVVPVVPVEQPGAPTERFDAPVFEECPGSECWAYRQGKEHSHLAGRIWHN